MTSALGAPPDYTGPFHCSSLHTPDRPLPKYERHSFYIRLFQAAMPAAHRLKHLDWVVYLSKTCICGITLRIYLISFPNAVSMRKDPKPRKLS